MKSLKKKGALLPYLILFFFLISYFHSSRDDVSSREVSQPPTFTAMVDFDIRYKYTAKIKGYHFFNQSFRTNGLGEVNVGISAMEKWNLRRSRLKNCIRNWKRSVVYGRGTERGGGEYGGGGDKHFKRNKSIEKCGLNRGQ